MVPIEAFSLPAIHCLLSDRVSHLVVMLAFCVLTTTEFWTLVEMVLSRLPDILASELGCRVMDLLLDGCTTNSSM